VQRLMERHGYSQTAMGGILGLKQNTVSALLAVNRLPERIRAEYPTSDRVSKSLLVELAAVPDAGEQLRLWDAVRTGGLTVRGVRAARATGEAPAPQPGPAAAAVAAARRLLGRLERLTPAAAAEPAGAMAELEALHAAIGKRLTALAAGSGHGRRKR